MNYEDKIWILHAIEEAIDELEVTYDDDRYVYLDRQYVRSSIANKIAKIKEAMND